MIDVIESGLLVAVLAIIAGTLTSIWAMVAGRVASAPVEIYWPLPISVFIFAAFGPVETRLSNIRDEEKGKREQQVAKELERVKRCAEVTSLQRVEFEDQFLLAAYFATDGDTRLIELSEVWSRLNHEFAPELTMHAIKIWRERNCIDVNDQFNVYENSSLSLTAAGRDLCMLAVRLDSMQKALSERREGYMVKNEYNFKAPVNAGAIGTNAHSELAYFVTATDESKLDTLAQELENLRIELLKVATSAQGAIAIGGVSPTEVGIAIGHISAAETEARGKNPQGVWENLAKVGRWVLDAAKQVGASLVVETINAVFKAYNIPIS